MSDPMADMQNILGYQGLVGPNPYLQYQGKIPMAGFYTGDAGNLPPTDATGKPIQSFVDYNNNAQAQYQQALAAYNAKQASGGGTPGTTLNSTPQSGQYGYPFPQPNAAMGLPGRQPLPPGSAIGMYQQASPQERAQFDALGQVMAMGTAPTGVQGSGRGTYSAQGALDQASQLAPLLSRAYQANAGQAAPQQGTPPSPPDLRQAYLNALANPGPANVYGAAPPQPGQAPTGAPQQPSVIQSFLAAHPGGGQTGAGGYSNTGFFNTLKQLQGGLG